ncbi:unnamed protein product [Linum tenue]|uniref:Uncharacterized protein n=1 Tax=Linum tenue TaxID=586396 RepID=A0AAV0P4D8_9ROSI|nr:unnamed protein product [Linum tenue]
MADKLRNDNSKIFSSCSSSGESRRLQRRRPASLQISPASSTFWSTAIPLLSPLDASPTVVDRKSEMSAHQNQSQRGGGEAEKKEAIVFKKWQHPAAPFCYKPTKLMSSFFVPVEPC